MPVFMVFATLEFSSMLCDVKNTLTISFQSGRGQFDDIAVTFKSRYQYGSYGDRESVSNTSLSWPYYTKTYKPFLAFLYDITSFISATSQSKYINPSPYNIVVLETPICPSDGSKSCTSNNSIALL